MFFRALARCGLVALFCSVPVISAHADLVGYWSFDGTLDDGTGNGNNGTFAGAPLPGFNANTPPAFGVGQSVLFGGGTGHVLVPDSPSLDISTALTIAAWVNPGGVAWDGILAKSPSDGSAANHAGNYELRVENVSRRLTFLYQRGNPNDTIPHASTIPVASNVWSHVALTAQAGGSVNFYVNGLPAGTFPTAAGFGATNNNPLYIGSRADLFTTMDGFIDELSLYNEVLTAAQINALAGGPPPEPPYPMLMPTFARASSQYLPDGRLAAHVVNGNGLVGKKHVNNPPGGTMWLTDGADAAPTFEIDLGGEYSVDQLRVWNYNESANAVCCLDRGVRTADIYVAGADGIYGATPAVTGATFSRAPGTFTDFSETVSLGGANARYVLLTNIANHGDASFTGLSEAKVTGTGVAGKFPLPATVKSASSQLGAPFDRRADYAVNSAGKMFGDTHTTIPDGGMWLTNGTLGAPNDTSPEITFDLGAEIALDRIKVWNYSEYRRDLPGRFDELVGRGVNVADILVAGEDMVFRPLLVGQTFDRVPDVGDDLGIFNEFDFSQIVDLGGVVARFVKFDIHSNHNGRDFNDPLDDDFLANFVGLSEVQFFAVPEPSTYLLAAMALAGIAVLRRRRG